MKISEKEILEHHAKEVRKRLLQIIVEAGGGHTGGSLSSVDILVALYFHVMHIKHDMPDYPERDRFIMSKGHSVEALYCVLSRRGFFDDSMLNTYGKMQSPLAGHPTRKIPGIELNSGALGHGLSVGVGMALAARRSGWDYKTFVLMGDGEQGEGSIMEAAAAAGHYHLDNLIAIIDRNKLQISGFTEETLSIEDLAAKYRACGWDVKYCDGHKFPELAEHLKHVPYTREKPSLLIAHTIKGKGISFIENKHNWHHKVPSKEQLQEALIELERL